MEGDEGLFLDMHILIQSNIRPYGILSGCCMVEISGETKDVSTSIESSSPNRSIVRTSESSIDYDQSAVIFSMVLTRLVLLFRSLRCR